MEVADKTTGGDPTTPLMKLNKCFTGLQWSSAKTDNQHMRVTVDIAGKSYEATGNLSLMCLVSERNRVIMRVIIFDNAGLFIVTCNSTRFVR